MSQENLLIGVSIIQVLLIPIILFFSKQLISYFFNKTIDLKKAELAQNLENYKKEIEQENKNFQHQLDAKLQEFNIKFSTLHQERAIIIKDLYIKIIELQKLQLAFRLMKMVKLIPIHLGRKGLNPNHHCPYME